MSSLPVTVSFRQPVLPKDTACTVNYKMNKVPAPFFLQRKKCIASSTKMENSSRSRIEGACSFKTRMRGPMQPESPI
jgi:hypothetical protein